MSEKRDNSYLYLFGGLFGAFIGILATYLLDKSAKNEGKETAFSRKNLSRVGISTISFLYSLIGKGRKGIL
jgi:hypothetical protein